ncbi:MAG: hypothetical protein ACFFC6_14450 [Promethearchaeota archaeon]
MKSQKRVTIKYLIPIFILFGLIIPFRGFGITQGMEGVIGEFEGNFRLLAGPKNSLHLFYRYSFQSADYGFDDWVVMSAVNFNFTAPIRVGGEVSQESTADLLEAIAFENSSIITFCTHPPGLDTWGFYGREWNDTGNTWDPRYPLFVGTDLQTHFGPQEGDIKTDYKTVYFGRYLPVYIDRERQLYLVVQPSFTDSEANTNPWFFQIDLDSYSVITKKEILFFSEIAHDKKLDTKFSVIRAGNSTNVVIQLKIGSQYHFVHYNGSEFSSNRRFPSSLEGWNAQWSVMRNGNLILSGFNFNRSLFLVCTLLHDDWVQKEYQIPDTWINILDWEINNKDVHVLAETPNGMIYAILNDSEWLTRVLSQFNQITNIDMSLADNGTAYLGGMNSDGHLGVVKLSLGSPLPWINATGWNSLVECGYPTCLEEEDPMWILEEIITTCVYIVVAIVVLKRSKAMNRKEK